MSQRSSKKVQTASSGTRGRRRVRFIVEAEPGSRVSVAGSFNGWDPGAHVLKETATAGRFERVVYLLPGDYQHKCVIDGSWSADPRCPAFTSNAFGTLNSVLRVKCWSARRRAAQASV